MHLVDHYNDPSLARPATNNLKVTEEENPPDLEAYFKKQIEAQ